MMTVVDGFGEAKDEFHGGRSDFREDVWVVGARLGNFPTDEAGLGAAAMLRVVRVASRSG